MKKRFLVDTSVLIEVSKGNEAALEWSERAYPYCLTSVIGAAEYMAGCHKKSIASASSLFEKIKPLVLTPAQAFRAAEFARIHGVNGRMPDYLIAATAEAHGLELATINIKDFPMFKNLKRPFEPRTPKAH